MCALGIVLPTRNSMAYLPAHLAGMEKWLDLAAEVVAVDSGSTDGTLDFIKANLRHSQVRLLSHPPGLYESWNHGLRNLTSEHAYISTVGDTITRDGLTHMLNVAETQRSDVVMSRPRFLHLDGREATPPFWPVHDMIQSLDITAPRPISKWDFLVFAIAHAGDGLLGSSASNLYRTRAFAEHPFPVNFGKAGDGVWALQNCCRCQWSITPKICSSFLLHPDQTDKRDRERWTAAPKLDLVLRDSIERDLKEGCLDVVLLTELGIQAMLDEMSRWLELKNQFDRARKARLPWILNPLAWQMRISRNRHAQKLSHLKVAALKKIRTHELGTSNAELRECRM